MRTARLLVPTFLVVLVVLTPVVAQSQLPGERLLEVTDDIHPMVAPDTALASLPDAPAPQRIKVIDKKFVAVMAALAGAELSLIHILIMLRRFFQDYKQLEGKSVEVDEILAATEAYPIIEDALFRYSEQRRKGFAVGKA